jgi:hypothetical protein
MGQKRALEVHALYRFRQVRIYVLTSSLLPSGTKLQINCVHALRVESCAFDSIMVRCGNGR